MRLINLTKEEFDKFGLTHKNKNFYQTSQYGTLMSRNGFNDFYFALIDDNNTIVAASLILIQRLFGSFKFAYAPRGFLIDFNDIKTLNVFTNELKNILLKQNVLYLKIDPYVIHIKRDNAGVPLIGSNNGIEIIENLKKIGFSHSGFNLYFENLKPRWNSVIKMDMSSTRLFDSFKKNTRNKIKKAQRRGIKIYKGTKDDIKLFYSLIDKKHTRNLNYYLDYFDVFSKNDMIDFYFAMIDIPTFLVNSKNIYEQEIKNNNLLNKLIQENPNKPGILNKKMESDTLLNIYKNDVLNATKMSQSEKQKIVIATSAIIKYDKEIFFLIDGFNNKYKNFNANYLLKWKIIEHFSKEGYLYFHLNGITGDFNPNNKYYGLYDFKKGFNSNVTEYIGEFDLVINKLYYNTYKNLKPFESIFNSKLKKQ